MNLAAIPVMTSRSRSSRRRACAVRCRARRAWRCPRWRWRRKTCPAAWDASPNVGGELFIAPQDKPGAWAPDRHQLSGRQRRQPVGRQRRPRRDRLRRQAVPPGGRHQSPRVAPRRPPVRAVRRAGPRERARARARGGRDRADRYAERAGGDHAARPVPHRREPGSRAHARSSCAKAKPTCRPQAPCSRCCRARSADVDGTDPQYANVQNGIGTDGFDTWVAEPRSPLPRLAHGELRVAADGRRRRSRPIRHLDADTGIRRGVVSERRCRRTGRRIATATGPTSAPGDRRGSTTRRGATRRSTTAAGPTSAAAGAGARARTSRVRCGRRRSSAGRAAPAGACPSAVGGPVYGWVPLAGASRTARGGAAARTAAGTATTGRMRSTSRCGGRTARRRRAIVNWNAPERRHRGVGLGVLCAPARAAEPRARVARPGGAPRRCSRARRRCATTPSRMRSQRPASAPPPASTFQPTYARPRAAAGRRRAAT